MRMFLLGFGILLFASLAAPAQEDRPVRVLFIDSYHQGFPWSDDIASGFAAALRTGMPEVELTWEHMDSKRFPPEQVEPAFVRLLAAKYSNYPFDVVAVSDDNAFNFALRRRAELFGSAPLVFCGVNDAGHPALARADKLTGVLEDVDMAGLLDLILHMHPRTTHIAGIADATETGALHLANLERAIASRHPGLILLPFVNWTVKELDEAVRRLPPTAVAVQLAYHRDREGRVLHPDDERVFVNERLAVPAYTLWDYKLGYGILGGVMSSGAVQGRVAADLVLALLRGVPIADLPVLDRSPFPTMFDHNALRRFDVARGRLPPEAVVINEPDSLWRRYRTYLAMTLLVVGVLSAVVVLLLVNIGRRIAAERRLLDLNARLEQQVEERTAELKASLVAVQDAQDQLVKSERLRLFGLLSAGMAHELNSPLGAIRSSAGTVIHYLDKVLLKNRKLLLTLDGQRLTAFRTLLAYLESRGPTEEFRWRRRNRIREALESRGTAAAGELADLLGELKLDPDESILPDILGRDWSVELLETVHAVDLVRSMMDVIGMAAGKAAEVVAALGTNPTLEDQGEPEELDVNAELDMALSILRNELDHGISVAKSYSEVRVLGSSNRLTQAWLNLIRNGAQAMDYRGTLRIATAAVGDRVEVRISDSGCGIPPDIQSKIFEPFFTTKAGGEGMGLGLDICRKIVESHGGTISFTSLPGCTEFIVSLPRA